MKNGRTCIERDPSALLYERQAPTLLAYFYRQTASWDDAEDLLVEVFLSALENARFRDLAESEQERWIWKVARHKVADHFRRARRQGTLPLDVEIMEAVLEDPGLTPEDRVLRQEVSTDLQAAFRTLPKVQQDVLELRYGHELSCGQIATVLGRTEAAVRMLLFRTLQQLRTIYKKTAR